MRMRGSLAHRPARRWPGSWLPGRPPPHPVRRAL